MAAGYFLGTGNHNCLVNTLFQRKALRVLPKKISVWRRGSCELLVLNTQNWEIGAMAGKNSMSTAATASTRIG